MKPSTSKFLASRRPWRHATGVAAPICPQSSAAVAARGRCASWGGAGGAAGAENHGLTPFQQDPAASQRRHETLDVEVPGFEPPLAPRHGVRGADLPAELVGRGRALAKRQLERRGHAQPLRSDRFGKRDYVICIRALERHVHRIEAQLAEGRVVHRRRRRMRERRAHHAVERGCGARLPHAVLPGQRRGRKLTGRRGAGERPTRSEQRRVHPADQPDRAQSDGHVPILATGGVTQAQTVAQSGWRHRDLEDVRRLGSHRSYSVRQIAGCAIEHVV
jgi:hypothetical protein